MASLLLWWSIYTRRVPTFEALDKLEIDWPVWMKKVQKAAVDNAETVRMSSASGTLKVLMFMEGVRNSHRANQHRLYL